MALEADDIITYAHKQQEVEELKLAVKRERLGVAYHFEKEIEEALEHIYAANHFLDDDDDGDGDLYNVSLGFRILRQHGHNVSCRIFNKFKDSKNGGFKLLHFTLCATKRISSRKIHCSRTNFNATKTSSRRIRRAKIVK
ncbi:hypothetical protein L3X38_023630 [Prunus dulcis]|uniref:Terpene synthase N-terminal domain-containing protein n=1 Tax=Prunus dulcis TaxID=3755 RepID=A0AAD4VZV4_PRUDU|nr:hypothetical protein L3X38_023630 [Prunus dulcis]